ncbi:MAG: adenylosuccinate lyase [Kiritimatiellae bacterium]|nr:adenylosuccinate lyase [Kiritimatiellia bacterium]
MPDATIENVLAERYASRPMREIWSPRGRIVLERELWIAVLKAQRDLGLAVPARAITAYERVKDRVNLDAIRKREAVTRHDVKARIDEFCALAGHEHIHKGMTSRDLTENVEQLQTVRSLALIECKAAALVGAFARRAMEWRDCVITARTHNVPAQPVTLGKRMAMFGEETLRAARHLSSFRASYPFRGLKGAVGTQLDPLTLMNGRAAKVADLERRVMKHLGASAQWTCTGQVYPRSLDFETISVLFQLGCGPANFACTLRLMAGHELASEGFAPGQTGSSAMPHKVNSRSCERIGGFHTILRGHVTMAAGLAGAQWNEGDVSCSVVRRVVLPDAFYAMDGLMDTALTVLNQMEIHRGVIARELERLTPWLSTTTLLMEAVRAGAGREEAHEAIKEHALAAARASYAGSGFAEGLPERLARDPRVRLSRAEIDLVLARAARLTGMADPQTRAFARAAQSWVRRVPGAAEYRPAPIL